MGKYFIGKLKRLQELLMLMICIKSWGFGNVSVQNLFFLKIKKIVKNIVCDYYLIFIFVKKFLW